MVVSGRYPTDPEHIGGGPYYIQYLQVQTLAERDDVEVYVVARSKTMPGYTQYQENGVWFHFLGEPRHRIIPRQLSMVKKIARVVADIAPDIVVTHDNTDTLGALKAGVPTAYMVHGIIRNEIRFYSGLARVNHCLQARRDAKAILGADNVICISEYGARCCREIGADKISVISQFPIVEDIFFDLPPYSNGKNVLFVGTLGDRRRIRLPL